MTRKLRAGIAGAAGYTGGELLRLLLRHPAVDIACAMSRSRAGEPVAGTHTDLFGDTDLAFSDALAPDLDVLFLCLRHGESRAFLDAHPVPSDTVVIDLGRDFRPPGSAHGDRAFVYGLPELHREAIRAARCIANPGCFATAIELALLPLAAEGVLAGDVHVNATTGSTGAGRSTLPTTHFTWRHSNLAAYRPFSHEHLPEIRAAVTSLQPSFAGDVLFVPQRGAFARGIHAACAMRVHASAAELEDIYARFCADRPFVHLSPAPVDLKQVVNTNKCLLHLDVQDGALLVTSVLDNLLKGASGQAVQNMNLRFGLAEDEGLRLKASAY